jgi:GAF domain-containing protein
MPVPGKVDSAGRGEPADIFVVEDVLRDDRFNGNAVVTGGANIRFYAGVPLRVAGASRASYRTAPNSRL